MCVPAVPAPQTGRVCNDIQRGIRSLHLHIFPHSHHFIRLKGRPGRPAPLHASRVVKTSAVIRMLEHMLILTSQCRARVLMIMALERQLELPFME